MIAKTEIPLEEKGREELHPTGKSGPGEEEDVRGSSAHLGDSLVVQPGPQPGPLVVQQSGLTAV